MLARLHLDQFCEVSKATPELMQLVKWIPGRNSAGDSVQVAIYPAGTVFGGDMAIRLCQTGQAEPADEECRQVVGMTADEIEAARIEYEMNTKGIWNKGDRELFRAGVILGYNSDLTHKPGPNWDAYYKAKRELEEGEI